MSDLIQPEKGSFKVKVGLAEMLKGGVIVEVESPEQAQIAEEAGAAAVIAIKTHSSNTQPEINIKQNDYLEIIQNIQKVVSIPVIAQCRIGHFIEAQILEALFVDFIDENEKLSLADEENDINKHSFKIPFACGSSDLGDALRHIAKGAAMIRCKQELGLQPISHTVKLLRSITREIRLLSVLDDTELYTASQRLGVPYSLLAQVAKNKKLPVPLFANGAISTPADVALMMHLGAQGIFINSNLFKFADPFLSIKALVSAVTHYQDPEILVRISMGLLDEMKGADPLQLSKDELFTPRGW